MIFVVDTNILFSACLAPEGRIFEILFNAPSATQLVSGHYAIEELSLHKEKLIRLSKWSVENIDTLLGIILKQVEFYAEEMIESQYWLEADRLTKGVDSKDVSFVALALQLDGALWTGDKKLATHLNTLDFRRVINTTQLYELLNIG